jgi:hypothetical protein
MDLIHIERPHVDDANRHLILALERRAKAAERCQEAIVQAHAARSDLLHHLAERLQAGADPAVLRRMLVDGAVPVTTSWHLLKEARTYGQP